MTVRLLVGDCRAMLATLPDASVHCVTTSPPYYGLRSYGTNPQVWGGDPACAHFWIHHAPKRQGGGVKEDGKKNAPGHPTYHLYEGSEGAHCSVCGAWRGELGSEPTPELFCSNLVAVFREVRRVLHPTGVLVLNLGSSYASGIIESEDSVMREDLTDAERAYIYAELAKHFAEKSETLSVVREADGQGELALLGLLHRDTEED